jgi:hypothetical protein
MAAAGLVVLLVVLIVLVVSALPDGSGEAATASSTTTMETTSTTPPPPVTSASSTTSSSVTTLPEAVEGTTTSSPPPSQATTTTETTAVPTTTTTAPPFVSSVTTPSASDLPASWEPGCPVAPADLRILTLSHWNYAGSVSTGKLVVAAGLANQVVAIFQELYEAGFPIERMELVDKYDGDDNQSMAANNTSAFNCRLVTGGSAYSEHSYGRAIDINPVVNPYVKGSTVLPPAGSAYVDRSLDAPGMIHANDEVVQAFAARGWIWGGTWSSLKDYQHFSTTGN